MNEPQLAAPEAYFTAHGLSLTGLRRAQVGFSNQVWLTDSAVLRLGSGADHPREARVALGALEAGVCTARPLFWDQEYSLWERLPGQMAAPSQLTPLFWNAVLDDLERLQAAPPEAQRSRSCQWWVGDVTLVGGAAWTPRERAALLALLSTPYPLTAPVFAHGDVYRHNLLADAGGGYAGLLDWGNAGWATLEHECAVLDDVEPALARWGGRLDTGLLWRLRLVLLLKVVGADRAAPGAVREVLTDLDR